MLLPGKNHLNSNTFEPFLDYDAPLVSIKKRDGLVTNSSRNEII